VSQVAEHLPSKHEALSSNTNTAKKKKKEFICTYAVQSPCFQLSNIIVMD
jgi:hypothetical protein